MLGFIKKQALYVLSGFIVTFAVYLFLRFDTDKVLIGLLVGLAGGVGVGVVLFSWNAGSPTARAEETQRSWPASEHGRAGLSRSARNVRLRPSPSGWRTAMRTSRCSPRIPGTSPAWRP